jgi:hypothetical protein
MLTTINETTKKKTKVLYASPLKEVTKANIVKLYKLPHDPWPQQTPTIVCLLWSCTFNQIESHKTLQFPQDLLQLSCPTMMLTMRSLQLCVYMNMWFHFTLLRLLQYTTFLPKT